MSITSEISRISGEVSDQADLIEQIQTALAGKTGGTSIDVIPLSVTENNTYTAPSGKAYSPVTVDVPTGTPRSSSDLTVNGATVTAPAGLYQSAASKSVASGTAGTPTATKGAVSNHSVTVTPSVENTSGYIAGGTKTGADVSVTAAELVSGSETKNENGTYDVTNLAQLVVNVAGTPPTTIQAGTTPVTMNTGFNRRAATSYGEISTSCRITIKKAGTYRFTWVMFRTATSGTYGTQLYKGTSAQGSAKTTFTNSYYAVCTQDIECAVNDSIRLYGRSNSTSTYIYAGYLTASILWDNGF